MSRRISVLPASAALALLLYLWAAVADARVAFSVEKDGRPISGAEVCFYPYDIDNPYSGFDAVETRCVSADVVLELPNRPLSFYFRHPSGYVSSNHGHLRGEPDSDAAPLRTIRWSVEPAAKLNLHDLIAALQNDERAVLIIGETASNRTAVMPLGRDDDVLVPARRALVVGIVRGNAVVALGDTLQLTAGKTYRVGRPTRLNGTDVLVRFEGDEPPDLPEPLISAACKTTYTREFLSLIDKQSVPQVTLVDSAGATHQPVWKVVRPANLLFDMYLFRGVAPGRASIDISGGHWLPRRVSVDIRDAAVAVQVPPVHVGVGGDISVHVNVPHRAPLILTRLSCNDTASERDRDRTVISLVGCKVDPANTAFADPVPAGCPSIEQREMTGDATLTFGPIVPSRYALVARHGGRAIAAQNVNIRAGTTVEATLSLDEFYVAGRVTRDGQPVEAEVMFASGTAVSDPTTGEYLALLSESPGKRPIRVSACDSSFWFSEVPKNDIPSGGGFDIEVPVNELRVAFVDDATGQRVDPDFASLSIVTKEHPSAALYQVPLEKHDTAWVAGNLKKGAVAVVCAELRGYAKSCGPPTEIVAASQSVELRLKRETQTVGKVLSPGYMRIFWAKIDGVVTEHGDVGPSGEFEYHQPHGNDEFITLAGSAPLFVIPASNVTTANGIEIAVPAGEVRQVTLRPAAVLRQNDAVIALWLNGVRVPPDAFVAHQRTRGAPWMMRNQQPVSVADIFVRDAPEAAIGADPATLPAGTRLNDPYLFLGRRRFGANSRGEIVVE